MFRATFPPVIALGLIAGLSANPARAADYLRGSYGGEVAPKQAVAQDWAGFYIGAFAGYSVTQNMPGSVSVFGPSGAAAAPASVALSEGHKGKTNFGGFAGVNFLWDDVIMGIEADYTHGGAKSTGSSPLTMFTDTGVPANRLNAVVSSTVQARDWGTFRGRVGYAMGMLMPYVTLGAALGNLDSSRTIVGTASADGGATWAPYASTRTKSGLAFGAAFGAGIEAQIIPNTFLRAEWQTVQFAGSGIRPETAIHSGRIGAGVKF